MKREREGKGEKALGCVWCLVFVWRSERPRIRGRARLARANRAPQPPDQPPANPLAPLRSLRPGPVRGPNQTVKVDCTVSKPSSAHGAPSDLPCQALLAAPLVEKALRSPPGGARRQSVCTQGGSALGTQPQPPWARKRQINYGARKLRSKRDRIVFHTLSQGFDADQAASGNSIRPRAGAARSEL